VSWAILEGRSAIQRRKAPSNERHRAGVPGCRAAAVLDVSPYPLAMVVAVAASAAFVTPVSSPVVTLVVAPGNYRFLDFVKVGLPLLVLAWATTLLVTPIFFPF
jgi:di/tricarboxylate transporter